jgi:PAS domain S-box-containing protein
LDGTIIYVNRYAEGYSKEQIIGSSIFDFVIASQRAKYLEIFKRTVHQNTSSSSEFLAVGGTATPRWYTATLIPWLHDTDAQFVFISTHDIHDRIVAEEQLQNTIDSMTGREIKMVELKKEVESLQEQLRKCGTPPPETSE